MTDTREQRVDRIVSLWTRAVIAIACVALSSSACFAVSYPDPRNTEEPELVAPTFPRLVVGVVEPEVHYVETPRPTDLEVDFDRLVNSFELVWLLRKTGYFEEVDFSRRLKSPPDVLIIAAPRGVAQFGNGGIVSIATLGIVPSIGGFHQDVGFSVIAPSGAVSATMSFTYQADVAYGFASLLLLPFPGWELPWPRPAYAVDDLRRLLVQRREVFEQFAHPVVP